MSPPRRFRSALAKSATPRAWSPSPAPTSKGLEEAPRGVRAARACWCSSSAAPSATSSGARPKASSPTSARACAPATPCCSAPTSKNPSHNCSTAYDDPTGVTAAFNLNLLARINRELGASFDLRAFAHEARYDSTARRIEMHLVSLARQSVTIPAAGVTVELAACETILTEHSHKFDAAEVAAMARRTGWLPEAQWIDAEWPFAETLLVA